MTLRFRREQASKEPAGGGAEGKEEKRGRVAADDWDPELVHREAEALVNAHSPKLVHREAEALANAHSPKQVHEEAMVLAKQHSENEERKKTEGTEGSNGEGATEKQKGVEGEEESGAGGATIKRWDLREELQGVASAASLHTLFGRKQRKRSLTPLRDAASNSPTIGKLQALSGMKFYSTTVPGGKRVVVMNMCTGGVVIPAPLYSPARCRHPSMCVCVFVCLCGQGWLPTTRSTKRSPNTVTCLAVCAVCPIMRMRMGM